MWSPVTFLGILVLLGLAVWCFIDPKNGAVAFFAVFLLFEGWLTLLLHITKPPQIEPNTPPFHLTDEETDYIRRNALVFRFPGTMRSFAAVLAFVGMVGLVLAVWFGFRGFWIETILSVANSIYVAVYLARRLDPISYYSNAAARGHHEEASDGAIWESAWEKILRARQERR